MRQVLLALVLTLALAAYGALGHSGAALASNPAGPIHFEVDCLD